MTDTRSSPVTMEQLAMRHLANWGADLRQASMLVAFANDLLRGVAQPPVGRYELAEFLCERLALESFDSISRDKYLGDAKAILEFLADANTSAQAAEEPVQDTWFTDSRLPIMAMSGDHESDRVLKLFFRRKVTNQDRAQLIAVLNAGEAALALPSTNHLPRAGATPAQQSTATEPNHIGATPAARDAGSGPNSGFDSRDGGHPLSSQTYQSEAK